MTPVTLLAWQITHSAVRGVTAAVSASGAMRPRLLGVSVRTWMAPCSSSPLSTRMTALCSAWEQITSSPSHSMPRIAVLIASVQLGKKMTFSGAGAPKASASSSRHLWITRPPHRDRLCPERPGLPPSFCSVPAMARTTMGGLGNEVAALSR